MRLSTCKRGRGGLVARLAAWLIAGAVTAVGGELTVLRECRLIELTDGDSFIVATADDRRLHVRLYFVDCPETTAEGETDARRVRDQSAYFGMPSHRDTLAFGRQAAVATRAMLARPFVVRTTFATAPGRSRLPRTYAFVETADGADLGEALVQAGLARAFGVGRATPDGAPRDEAGLRLSDLEFAAALRRAGIWARSDPERLVALRADARRDEAELARVRTEAESGGFAPINLNLAETNELTRLPGIGPALALRIVAARPFRSLDELARVPGIGPGLIERLRGRATVPDGR